MLGGRDETLLVKLPGRVFEYKNLKQTAVGYTFGNQTAFYSTLSGDSADIHNLFVPRMTERTDVDQEAALNWQLAEYGLRSLTTMAESMLAGMNADGQVAAALDCHLKSFNCFSDTREAKGNVKKCSQELCNCVELALKG